MVRVLTENQKSWAQTISRLMKENKLELGDITGIPNREAELQDELQREKNRRDAVRGSLCDLERIVREVIFPKFVDEMGEDEAYEWFEDKISSDWLTELDLIRPRYKVVSVCMEFKVVMPDDCDEGDWVDYADGYDWSDYAETSTDEGELTRDEVVYNHDTINDVDRI